jgi:hypothetical protein
MKLDNEYASHQDGLVMFKEDRLRCEFAPSKINDA